MPAVNGTWDPSLSAYLNAPDEASAERRLQSLLRGPIESVSRIVIRSRLRHTVSSQATDLAEEAYSEVVARMISRLRRLREVGVRIGEPISPITDLEGYTATTVAHICDDLLRRRFPQRARLKNRIRYLLRHTTDFACWEENEVMFAGLARWQQAGGSVVPRKPLPGGTPEAFLRNHLGGSASATGLSPAELCRAVFQIVTGPIPLDELVDLIALAKNIHDDSPVSLDAPIGDDTGFDLLETLKDPHGNTADIVERREMLGHVWQEIRRLPPRQCCALLMNLRDADGSGVIALLPLLDIASMEDIASVLSLSLPRLQELWEGFPIDDSAIATLLGASRQQVINLRKVARERLSRKSVSWREVKPGDY